MEPERVQQVAELLRQEHGDAAERFCLDMIKEWTNKHVHRETIDIWALILRALMHLPGGPGAGRVER